MKRLIFYSLIWWFWFAEYKFLAYFSDCYLADTAEYGECLRFDFNGDGIVNLQDYALLVKG